MLGELRQQVLTPIFGNPLFTAAEQLRANHFVHECEDEARLLRWHANVLAELALRTAAAARQRSRVALHATLRRLRPAGFQGHRPRRLRPTPTWQPGAPLPCRPDCRAGTLDYQTAARFQPADTLSYAHLLARQPQ